jgi:hypothetical protein
MTKIILAAVLSLAVSPLHAQNPQAVSARELILRASNSQCSAAGGTYDSDSGWWLASSDYQAMMRAIPQRLLALITSNLKFAWQQQYGWMMRPTIPYKDWLEYYVTNTFGFDLDVELTKEIVLYPNAGRAGDGRDLRYAAVLRTMGYQ